MTTLQSIANQDTIENVQAPDLLDLVQQASRVIAPLWPLQTFAARSPWMHLEHDTFTKTAEAFRTNHQIDLYPDVTVLRKALDSGKIDELLLEARLEKWMLDHPSSLNKELAWTYAWESLRMRPVPQSFLSQVKKQMKGLTGQAAPLYLEGKKNRSLSLTLQEQGIETPANLLDSQMIKWCKLYLDQAQSEWALPFKDKGLYHAWRKLVGYDRTLPKAVRKALTTSPEHAMDALKRSVERLNLRTADLSAYFESHFLQLPGWVGVMTWMIESDKADASLLIDYMAIRMSLEVELVTPYLKKLSTSPSAISEAHWIAAWCFYSQETMEEWLSHSTSERKARLEWVKRFSLTVQKQLLLEAWEATYDDQLKRTLLNKTNRSAEKTKEAVAPSLTQAQIAFCIDVRSELYRRHLEQSGPFETFGIAGFFGLQIEKVDWTGHAHASLPVILKPKHRVVEHRSKEEKGWFLSQHNTKHAFQKVFKQLKQGLLSSLVLPELSGSWMGLHLVLRALFPRGTGSVLRNLIKPRNTEASTELHFDPSPHAHESLPIGLTLDEQVGYVRDALKSIGLSHTFAPLIVFCGHGSSSTNNPYAASLDCGACGGASGGFNARLLAECANREDVRQALAKLGMEIPSTTRFAAAEHLTTTDEWEWVYVPRLSEQADQAFKALNKQLPVVRAETTKERLTQLSYKGFNKNTSHVTEQLKEDWSEIRPEWGLARNASFIIGRRDLTRSTTLDGRAFLHSYDWTEDSDGQILTNILSGPGTVAQWINLQYYASTVAPEVYGSGSKTTQTVTSGFGVMQGNGSDLLQGLPIQSVQFNADEPYHEPLRLLVVIEAPFAFVDRILAQLPSFKQKVTNGWLRLAVLTPDNRWHSF